MEPPPERLEVLLTQAISIASTSRGVIAAAVAFDRENKLTRPLGVLRYQIDPVLRRAPLWKNVNAFRAKCIANVLLEIVQRNVSRLATRQASPAFRRVLQEPAQQLYAFGFGASWIHVQVTERGDNRHSRTGTGDGDVEPPLPSFDQ